MDFSPIKNLKYLFDLYERGQKKLFLILLGEKSIRNYQDGIKYYN